MVFKVLWFVSEQLGFCREEEVSYQRERINKETVNFVSWGNARAY